MHPSDPGALHFRRQPSRAWFLYSSLQSPGHNLTGVNLRYHALDLKRLEMLHEFYGDTKSPCWRAPERVSPQKLRQNSIKKKEWVAIPVNPNGELEDASSRPSNRMLAPCSSLRSVLFNRRDRIAALAAQYKIPRFTRDGNMLWPAVFEHGQASRMHIDQIGVYAGRILPWGAAAGPPGCIAAEWEL